LFNIFIAMVLVSGAPLSQRYYKYIEDQRQRVVRIRHVINTNEEKLFNKINKLNDAMNTLPDNEISRRRKVISKLREEIDKDMNKLTEMIEAVSRFINDREDVLFDELNPDEYYSSDDE
jgi:hypothetical protein